MSLQIVPLADRHLADAAALFAARYAALRDQIPEAPERYELVSTVLPLLSGLLERGQGFAALRGSRLAGFLAARLSPQYRGQRTVYSPEWANAAEADDSPRIYRQLYAAASAQWMADHYCDHYLTLLAHDAAGIAAWHWLGFGSIVVDGIRGVQPLPAAVPPGIAIRQAGPADCADGLLLWQGLMAHLAAAPIFLTDGAEAQPEQFTNWFADPANALWLAYRAGRPVAALGVGPASDDASTVIRDAGTASFISAYTLPEARGSGIASALLDRAVGWARAQGYVRCAVDFETANSQAAAFWPRHFRLICHSLGRRVNPYILAVTAGQ